MRAFSLTSARIILTASIITVLLVLAPQAAEAYQPRAYVEPRFFRSPILHVDDQHYEMGWFDHSYASAAHAFGSNPAAKKHFDDYLTDARLSKHVLWGTIGATLTFLIMDHNKWHLPEKEGNLIYNGLSIGGLATAIYFASSSGFHLGKAINIYNGHEKGEKFGLSRASLSITPVIFLAQNTGNRGTSGGLSFRMEL